jgi:hypothetical protein
VALEASTLVRGDRLAGNRHSQPEPSVTGAMDLLRAVLPYVRPLLLAILATVIILIGLPAVLALGAAAGA